MEEKLKLIPNLPGSYQMLDKDGIVIYVGKAKNLKRRVTSYFKSNVTGKTKMLVSEIKDFTYITTSSELESFILELNLIKKYNPKYNILLKDDKSYPYIEYLKKPYPVVKVSRYLSVKKSDKLSLFGPYPNAYAARRIVNLLNRLYPLKKCDNMPKEVCLYYHINECLGYCEKNIDNDKLTKMEEDILGFLRGNENILKEKILEKIKYFSDQLNFEVANDLKKELEYIDIVMKKQKVELNDYINRDVIGYYYKDTACVVQFLFIRNGKIVGAHNNIFYVISELYDEISSYLLSFYENHEIPKEILICEDINNDILSQVLNTKFVIPKRGKKKNLVNMAINNAKINLENEIELLNRKEEKTMGANNDLSKILDIPIHRIDAFDNSNLFGSYSVSGMVVFINGKPAKKEYRKYKISLEKNDDYNTMKEVIYRRYYRVLVDNLDIPSLIIVDGGINQINACKEVLGTLNLNIKVVGLKKDDKHQTKSLIDGDTYSEIDLTNHKNVFFYLTKIQDEVHRYTITYHKLIRSKGSIASVLDNVPNIGTVRKKELIKKYGSVKNISMASIEELNVILPENVSHTLKKYLEEWNNK